MAGALNANPQSLGSLVTDFNTTAGAFARQSAALQDALAELPRTLSAAIPAFNALNASLPPLTTLAEALLPGVRSAGPAIDATLPLVDAAARAGRADELGGLATNLARRPGAVAADERDDPADAGGVRPASSCLATVVYPWSQLTLKDPHFNASNGFPPRKVYVEAVDYLPGLAGESRNFDANGAYIRVLLTAGSLTYSLTPGAFGQAVAPLISTQPTLPPGGKRPPLRPDVPCETQTPIHDLSSPTGPPLRRSCDEARDPNHIGDFVAILGLLILAAAVAGYILEHERFRFPLIESAQFKIDAEFSTAQAVAPAQGQTVRVSGVQIGDIGGVRLRNGLAVVTLDIDQRYKHLIHSDATALLRPRTGLKDMFVELDPGPRSRPWSSRGSRSRSPTRPPTSTSTRSCPRSTATPGRT